MTLVVGQAQQGKTTLALRLLVSETYRGLILDPVRSKPLSRCAARMVGSWHELAAFLVSRDAEGSWLVILRSMEFTDYVMTLRAAPYLRHVTMLVDEGLTFAGDPAALDPLVKISRMNAHFGGGVGMPVIITAQRPMDLPRDVRSQADRWYSFRQEEPGDLGYLSERCSPDFAARVAGLGPHEFLTFPSDRDTRAAEETTDASRLEGGGLRPRGAGGVGAVADGATTQLHPQTPGPHEVVSGVAVTG